MSDSFSKHQGWLIPVIFILLLTPFTPYLDLAISTYFYLPQQSFAKMLETTSPSMESFYAFIFFYGVYPAFILFFISIILLVASYLTKRGIKLRASAWLLFLTMVVGSGLITNLVLKEHWGRPRPKQIVEFGGDQKFRPYYEPNFFHQPEPSKSFPSGHVTMGFYFLTLVLIGRRLKQRRLIWLGIFLTLTMGGMLSVTRIAQGGHFFSDALFAGLIMWLTAYFFDRWIFRKSTYKKGSL